MHSRTNYEWTKLFNSLLMNPAIDSRNGPMFEQINCNLTIKDPTDCIISSRRMSPFYAAGELIWYLSGSDRGDQICHYAPSYKRFLSKGVGVVKDDSLYAPGAYGPRIMEVMQDTIDELSNLNSRRAVVPIFTEHDVFVRDVHNDTPCTLSLQFILRDAHLSLITTMRSNDLYLGFPYDMFCFTSLQRIVAWTLGVDVGSYHHNVGSMHLYSKNVVNKSKTIGHRHTGDWLPSTLDSITDLVSWERSIRSDSPDSHLDLEDVDLSLSETFETNSMFHDLAMTVWLYKKHPSYIENYEPHTGWMRYVKDFMLG